MMASDPFFEEDFRVLTPEAFDFVLHNELKRAVRSQNFLTLVQIDPVPAGRTAANGDRDRAVREIARLTAREVRETDLLSHTSAGRLSLVLLDADLQSSLRVVDRLMARFEHYAFIEPISIDMGAACCPTHGADVESLRRAAESHPLYPRPERHDNAS
jgi:GGDEF domain-containing protein